MRGVSVVIPTVRIDHWLDEAVASILASTGVEVDLIVVHDGVEPDLTRGWTHDKRVQLVHHSVRLGQTEGMESGVARARFDLVARLDADDLSSPNRLHEQSGYLDTHPDAVATGTRVMRIDNRGVDRNELVMPTGPDIRSHLLFQNVVAHSSLMFRLESSRAVHGYNKALRQMEDYDFILRLATQGPIANLDAVLTRYRVHPQQTSRGAAPWGEHIRSVMKDRVILRRVLGERFLLSTAKNWIWTAVQYARYFRVIRPGYER